jgi:hypothetical protein
MLGRIEEMQGKIKQIISPNREQPWRKSCRGVTQNQNPDYLFLASSLQLQHLFSARKSFPSDMFYRKKGGAYSLMDVCTYILALNVGKNLIGNR